MPKLIRQPTGDRVTPALLINERLVEDMTNYFYRQTDKLAVQSAIVAAHGVGIANVEGGGETTIETYVRSRVATSIYSGEKTIFSIGYGSMICNAKATLFSEPGVKYSLQHDSVEDLKKFDYLLAKHRLTGGHKAALVAADKLAVFLGSSAVLVTYRRGSIRYQKISPGRIRPFFAGEIEEDGERRPTDTSDIQDASLVLIRMSQVDATSWSWIGIQTRCAEQPFGRYVTFISATECYALPPVGEPLTYDYRLASDDMSGAAGAVANPLSWLAEQYPDLDIPEVPIVPLYGGTTEQDALFPITSSLYSQCLSIDMMSSHITDKADEKASGTSVLLRDHQGKAQTLPRTLHGNVALLPGQSIEHLADDASSCDIANSILKDRRNEIGESYGVPDYMVSGEDTNAQDEASGLQLKIKTRPLVKDRENRVELNRPSVIQLSKIERGYLVFKGEVSDSESVTLLEADQNWEAGRLKMPDNLKEKSEIIVTLKKEGIFDELAGIAEWYECTTEEAQEIYDKMKMRKEKYPPLNPPPDPMLGKPIVGLNRGKGAAVVAPGQKPAIAVVANAGQKQK